MHAHDPQSPLCHSFFTGTTTSYICEHDSFSGVSCPPTKKISIAAAIYGRTSTAVCMDSLFAYGTNCRSNVTSIVARACNGLTTCQGLMPIAKSSTGDPCQNVYKYLEVKYLCLGELTISRQATPCYQVYMHVFA